MGFFGGCKRGFEKVKKAVLAAANYVKTKALGAWNKYTGKDTFQEADELYNKIKERREKRHSRFKVELREQTVLIDRHVVTINQYKKKIKTELFVQMAEKMKALHDIEVNQNFHIEEYIPNDLTVDPIREKSDLYLIDFNKHKVLTAIEAVFTLGFSTRKKAKETLLNVQDEEVKVEDEIKRMDTEISKLKAINQSLENVELYFSELISIYEKMLLRLDNNVNYLYLRCLSVVHKLVKEEMSIRKLPIIQVKEIEAIVTASKVLKEMVNVQILSVEKKEDVVKYEEAMKEKYKNMKNAA